MDVLEREPQLATLEATLGNARRGSGQVVMVAGEAGVGKTTLVDTFCRDVARQARVLRGSCDPVVPARAFAPLADMEGHADPDLSDALASADRARVFDVFLGSLRVRSREPTIVVLEDLHWADEATLDLLRVIGRRVRELPVLVIATYRDDEVDATHPLRQTLGDLPARDLTTMTVPPLSPAGVSLLAAGSAVDPVRLHRVTAGNPFFVTEVLAAGGEGVPVTIRDAVTARAARLSPAAREVLATAAVLGYRTEDEVVRAVAKRGVAAVDQCVARGVLRREGSFVSFRHELARQAILEAMPSSEQVSRHRRALSVLQAGPIRDDAARLTAHAEGAGDAELVLSLAPLAAERAAELGAHRESAAHYATALRRARRLAPRRQAELLEAYARESSLAGDVGFASDAQKQALEIWRSLGDRLREGDCLRALSVMTYLAGDGERARQIAELAVAILESVGAPSRELALAYAVLAQRHVVAGDDDGAALAFAGQALDLAERLGDEAVAVHALNSIGVTEIYMARETGWSKLEASANRADAAGLLRQDPRPLINLVEAAKDMRRYDAAERYAMRAKAYVRDFDLYDRILRGRLAELAFERGQWDAAAEHARSLIDENGTATVLRVRALTLLGRYRARRGEGDPWTVLDEALETASPVEIQELTPLHTARAEAAWLDGDLARAGKEALIGLELGRRASDSVAAWWWGEAAFWAWQAGAIRRLPSGTPAPYRLHAAGRHRDAAAAWAEIGAPYAEALALAESADESDLRRGLSILQRLGADPAARRVVAALQRLGALHVPRGPRQSTRRNPAGLTAREMEVLELLGRHMRNAEIAEHLVLSPKTVDHHVSAILHKLSVPNRASAVEAAALLDLKDGDRASQG